MRRVETHPSIPQRVLWWIAAAFVVVIPLYVSPRADDVFRLPKELLLRAEGILIVAVVAASVIWQPREFRDFLFDRVTGLGVAACAFATVIATALSTNRAISAISAAYVLSCIVAFWGVYIGAAGRSLTAVVVVGSAAGIVNALIAIVQRLGWWNPFQFDPSISDRMQITALVGNPNDTGASLAVCFVALAAFVCIKRRAVPAGTALLLLIGVVASDALTAMLAVAAAGAVLAVLASRLALLSVGIIALAFVSLVATLPALRARAALYTAAARARDYDLLTDHRIVGYMTAWMIFRDHPLTGAGPGTFKWHYLPYRLQVEAHHPEYYLKMNESLGEVH
ncbi:MAG TPA: O-antigen ligase family protein, partial [Thermoanaerobaculia bacterium]|nr:O-antigen ligase family protein [Thermoanaerobaculia bacterium]